MFFFFFTFPLEQVSWNYFFEISANFDVFCATEYWFCNRNSLKSKSTPGLSCLLILFFLQNHNFCFLVNLIKMCSDFRICFLFHLNSNSVCTVRYEGQKIALTHKLPWIWCVPDYVKLQISYGNIWIPWKHGRSHIWAGGPSPKFLVTLSE